MYPWEHIEPFKNDKYDIHNYLLRKILICSLRNVVIFTLSLRLRSNLKSSMICQVILDDIIGKLHDLPNYT